MPHRSVPRQSPGQPCGQTPGGATAVLALAAAIGLALAAPSQPEAFEDAPHEPVRETRIDRTTGQHQAWWARSPQCDFLHMRLDVTIPDMDVPHLDAVQTLTVRGLAGDRASLTLDIRDLKVESVRVDARPAEFHADDRTLTITFPGGPLRLNDERTLQINYSGDFLLADGLGLNWTLGDADADTETDRFSQIHTQGQSENNAEWFPCHDSPNERLSTEILVRLPDGYTALANGRLVGTSAGDSDLITWHYLQERPHPTYLVSLVVGVFDAVELAGPGVGAATDIPMVAYGPTGTAENMREVFAGTPDMLAFFEDWLDEPYPWDRYDQVCVRDFHSGGMENTSMTSMYEQAARSSREREEDLISHELIHMWFGDLITNRTWDHLWLNEGWATYGEVLWREERARQEAIADGLPDDEVASEARRAMLEYMLQLMRAQRRFNRSRAPMDPALASNLYTDPELVFERADDAYNKGGAVLHMLRIMLGDDLFQKATRLYVDRHKDGLVETDDLRRCFEEVSGHSLERFFTQWVERPGLPRLDVTIEWDGDTSELVVNANQRQRIDADNPAYAFLLPIEIRSGDDVRTVMVPMDERSASMRIPLDDRPEQVAVDPELSIFCATRVEKDLTWWRHEAEHAPTIVARIDAIEALAASPDATAGDLLLLARLSRDLENPELIRETAGRGALALVARGLTTPLFPVARTFPTVTQENPS